MIEKFITYIMAERRYSAGTAANYERSIRRFCSDTGIDAEALDPALVAPDDIRDWIVSLSQRGLAPVTVNNMVVALRAFLRWARKVGAVEGDPFLRIAMQRTPTKLPTYIAEGKMMQLLDELPDTTPKERRNSLIITLFYASGIRLAELLGIRIADFSADFGQLKVLGKGNKERIVPLPNPVAARVARYVEDVLGVEGTANGERDEESDLLKNKSQKVWKSAENFLFSGHEGVPLSRNEAYRIVRSELTRAGVQGKKSPHVLRHTYATHMLNNGADMREIQELLGHSSLAATQVYTHNSIAKLKEAYKEAHPRGKK